MYTIDYDKYASLLTWDSLFWGIEKELLFPEAAIAYAEYLAVHDIKNVEDKIVAFMITEEKDRDTILAMIQDLRKGEEESSACRSLRYILMLQLQQNEKNTQQLLEALEVLYADFGYPKEMSSFIGYMPVQEEYDPTLHTVEENRTRLIKKFENFMTDEWAWLQTKK